MNMETSDDILRQIENVTNGLPGEGVESITSEWPRTKKVSEATYENTDDPLYAHLEQKTEREALVNKWKAEETQRIQEEYQQTGVIPPYRPFEQWVQEQAEPVPRAEMQQALLEDIQDLQERYGTATAGFFRRLKRGEIELPEDLLGEDNALEQFFINSVTEEEARNMTTEELQRFITSANEKPLLTRSLDIAVPERKPKPQPRKQQTYTMPELTQDELREALTWAIQKKMGGGR
jgi:hypothetical protein